MVYVVKEAFYVKVYGKVVVERICIGLTYSFIGISAGTIPVRTWMKNRF